MEYQNVGEESPCLTMICAHFPLIVISHFQYSDLDRLTVLLSLISPMNRGDLGMLELPYCFLATGAYISSIFILSL